MCSDRSIEERRGYFHGPYPQIYSYGGNNVAPSLTPNNIWSSEMLRGDLGC